MPRSLVVAALLALAGCGGEPSYEPLVCDPSRAGELAFGVQVAGAVFVPTEQRANGAEVLLVDHACRWWAESGTPRELRTGTLDAPTLATMNAELLTRPFLALDGTRIVGTTLDGDTTYLGRGGARIAVADDALIEDERLGDLLRAAHAWAQRLAAEGEPMTGERVRLELEYVPVGSVPDGTTPLADLDTHAWETVVVVGGDDAGVLRRVRHGTFDDGGASARFDVIDTPPFADARGCLRPLGGRCD